MLWLVTCEQIPGFAGEKVMELICWELMCAPAVVSVYCGPCSES